MTRETATGLTLGALAAVAAFRWWAPRAAALLARSRPAAQEARP